MPRETYEEMRERAREIADQAPPFTAEQIIRLRTLLGIDRSAPAPQTAAAGVPAPAAAITRKTPTTRSISNDDTRDDQSTAA
ncbi:hypothetical protein [Frankia tisae]|uniref:hypothetical protein n=1 Tax=Frankia tisae TaxID=2950104 RepID=UPI0021BF5F1C|nr:hypothetical protein [Frankia tisae]